MIEVYISCNCYSSTVVGLKRSLLNEYMYMMWYANQTLGLPDTLCNPSLNVRLIHHLSCSVLVASVECLCGVKVSQVYSIICVRWTSSVWQANRDVSTCVQANVLSR